MNKPAATLFHHQKGIAIFGSTGSIGRQTLEVIAQNRELFKLKLLTAHSNHKLLAQQSILFRPEAVYLANPESQIELKEILKPYKIRVIDHDDELYQTLHQVDLHLVVLAIVGFAGLKPAVKILEAGKNLAIANKESLVVAGKQMMDLARKMKAQILPIDSEHSAIFQCLMGEKQEHIEKVILTASGGPFLNYSSREIEKVTLSQALTHPTWEMGKKITIDSASLMNKGLEVIEAKWLFNLNPDQIDVVAHPQSLVHSMVQFTDGSVKAQMSPPNMQGPIQFALFYPHRQMSALTRFNFSETINLSFQPIDLKKFRNLALAFEALKKGGNMPAILNAANEAAVAAVLKNELPFYKISLIVEKIMSHAVFVLNPSLDELEQIHFETIIKSNELIRSIN